MANVNGQRQRGDGEGGLRLRGRIWWLLYRANGVQHAESSKSENKAVALALLSERLTDTRRGAIPAAVLNQFTYEDLRDNYLRVNPSQKNADALSHLNAFFAGLKVNQIADAALDFIEYRRETVSDPTIRRNLVTLLALFGVAKKQGKVQSIPYIPLPDDSGAAGTFITPSQFAKILSHLPENLRPSFQFLYSTGCRIGEAKQITWSMVNSDCTVINVPKEIVKADKPHTLVLAGKPLESVVAGLRKHFRTDGGLVFDFTNYQKAWNKATAAVGLLRRGDANGAKIGVRIHDLRVSFATNGTNAGVSTTVLMTLGGWTTLSSFLRYNIVNVEGRRAAMEQAGAHVAAQA
jgi:integrase